MSDLVERLRDADQGSPGIVLKRDAKLLGEAADTIERLTRERNETRANTFDAAANELISSYPDHAWLNAACAALRARAAAIRQLPDQESRDV